jgi:hypothetical protein
MHAPLPDYRGHRCSGRALLEGVFRQFGDRSGQLDPDRPRHRRQRLPESPGPFAGRLRVETLNGLGGLSAGRSRYIDNWPKLGGVGPTLALAALRRSFSLACRLNAVHRPLQLEAKSFPIQGFADCTRAYIR